MKKLFAIMMAPVLALSLVFLGDVFSSNGSLSVSAQSMHSTAHKTKKVTQKTYTRGKHKTKWGAHKTKRGTKWTYHKTKRGAKWTTHKTKVKTKHIFHKTRKAM